jgi:hypothetical protein
MATASTIEILYSTMGDGFRFGPKPDETHHCGHRWGNHKVIAKHADPLDGGSFHCGDADCECEGTWDVPQGNKLRQKIAQQKREEDLAARRDQ